MAISDLYTDLRDGIMLINLLEAISEKKVGPYNRNPRIGAQRLENQGIALNFIKVRERIAAASNLRTPERRPEACQHRSRGSLRRQSQACFGFALPLCITSC